MPRKATITRKTKETDIKLSINLDGKGDYKINTSAPFLDHMLSLMSKHGHLDLNIQAKGDIEIDYHHLIEDIGIVLGEAIKKALGKKLGIRRYGESLTPMDETLAQVALDLSGRPYLVYNVKLGRGSRRIKDVDISLFEDFFRSVSNSAGMNLHINLAYGRDLHHIIESIFKGFGRALRSAVEIHGKSKGVPSTKGTL
jgi:imidazoleglycerol-phosphate dehydratase